MTNPIDEIEAAIIKTIKDASDNNSLGYKIPLVTTYAGEVDDANMPNLLKGRSPAVWVTFHGEDDSGKICNNPDNAAYFDILVYVRNPASPKAASSGTLNSTGINQIVADIKKLLIENSLNLEIEPLKFIRTDPIYKARMNSYYSRIYGLRFKTRYFFRLAGIDNRPLDKLDNFERVHSVWTVRTNQSDLNFNVNKQE